MLQAWPKHRHGTSVHQIVMDGVSRDFTTDQIVFETNGLATKEMVAFYRDASAANFQKMLDEERAATIKHRNHGCPCPNSNVK